MWASLGLWGKSKSTGKKTKQARAHLCFKGFDCDYFQHSLTICNMFFSQELLIKIDVLQQAVVRQGLPRCLGFILQKPEKGKHQNIAVKLDLKNISAHNDLCL